MGEEEFEKLQDVRNYRIVKKKLRKTVERLENAEDTEEKEALRDELEELKNKREELESRLKSYIEDS